MEEDSNFTRFKLFVSRYLWEAKRGIYLKKVNFYRELSPLERVFTVKDCTLLSYGSVVGIGLHIILPFCIETYGAMMMFSVALNALRAIISCMCFAELASLAPSTGSVYHYCYHTMGELVGFMTGWNMIFSYSLCCSFVLRYLGKFIDNNLLDHEFVCAVRTFLGNFHPTGYEFYRISNDVVLLCLIFSILLAAFNTLTVEFAKRVNNAVVIMTIVFTYFCLFMYTIFIDFSKAHDPKPVIGRQFDFLICASSHLAFCFDGYQVVTCLGEEAVNPSETIPKSILFSMKFATFTYILLACLHTLVWSFGEQDDLSPISVVLIRFGLWPMNHAATIAAMTGMWSSASAAMFAIIRITYAMSRDGLIPKVFSRVSMRTKAPMLPAIFLGLFIGISGTMLDEHSLADIGEVGIVSSKIMATVCLLITRYRCENISKFIRPEKPRWLLVNYPETQTSPTKTTHSISKYLILNLVLAIINLVLVARCVMLYEKSPFVMRLVIFLLLFLFLLIAVCLYQQPQNDRSNLYYMVRGVPTIPILVIVYDVYILTSLGIEPWIAIFFWSFLGILFYFLYSVSHSVENRTRHADGSPWTSMRSSVHIDAPSEGQT